MRSHALGSFGRSGAVRRGGFGRSDAVPRRGFGGRTRFDVVGSGGRTRGPALRAGLLPGPPLRGGCPGSALRRGTDCVDPGRRPPGPERADQTSPGQRPGGCKPGGLLCVAVWRHSRFLTWERSGADRPSACRVELEIQARGSERFRVEPEIWRKQGAARCAPTESGAGFWATRPRGQEHDQACSGEQAPGAQESSFSGR